MAPSTETLATEHVTLVTDMHLAPDEADAERAQSELDRPPRRAEHLDRVLSDIQHHRPAAVLFGGDLANQPVSQTIYRELALSWVDRFPHPWRAIPGNHDVGSCIGWHHHDPEALAEASAAFGAAFGGDRWTISVAGFRIIAINSQIAGSGLPEARAQTQWLLDELASDANGHVRVVLAHTPLYLEHPTDDFDDGSEMMCLKPPARRELMDTLERCPPDLLITAHAHRFWQCRAPQWDWLGLPATAFGQAEMRAVPSHRLPTGDDRIGWVELRRRGESWEALHHKVAQVG